MDLSLFLGGVCLGSLFASLNSASTLKADVCITNVSRTKKMGVSPRQDADRRGIRIRPGFFGCSCFFWRIVKFFELELLTVL